MFLEGGGIGGSEQKSLGSSSLQDGNCDFHKSWMYVHFSWALALAGTFEQCHMYGRCWLSPRSVRMRQSNVAEELKEGQELQDLNPEARNRSQIGWEGLEV